MDEEIKALKEELERIRQEKEKRKLKKELKEEIRRLKEEEAKEKRKESLLWNIIIGIGEKQFEWDKRKRERAKHEKKIKDYWRR